ncbi:hypothetical protein [Ruegeria marina]|uniref:Uncharacterized protein n=1 Tax=Ruegeria marina TaxID=639004 RepID=A0A1G7A9Z3_9RHOB|nr:hypothetical protein [Ruegeria marina]SDE11317.1 hypothetical protein SAMN04488239_11447 [Ruegeria marina]
MIWTTDTHNFSATLCQRTGKPCSALAAMAQNLAHAMNKAEATTGQDFEIEGEFSLPTCPGGCRALYAASHRRIRVFCGVTETAETSWLNRMADALMDPQGQVLTADGHTSACAFAEAVRTPNWHRQPEAAPM